MLLADIAHSLYGAVRATSIDNDDLGLCWRLISAEAGGALKGKKTRRREATQGNDKTEDQQKRRKQRQEIISNSEWSEHLQEVSVVGA